MSLNTDKLNGIDFTPRHSNSMKPAEEWMQLQEPKSLEPARLLVVNRQIIREIQLDAMKEGARRAANILQKQVSSCHGPGEHDDCMPCVARNNSTIDILSIANQWTLNDL